MATADLTRPALGSRRVEHRTPADWSAGVLCCAMRPRGYDAGMRSIPPRRAWLGLVLAAIVVVGCTGSPATPAASPTATPSPTPVPATPSPASAAPATAAASPAVQSTAPSEPAATPVGTTQTPWGRILDAVPDTFPVFPGATITDAPPQGPASGAWVSNAPVAEVASWYRDALVAAHYAKVDLGSPLEDGSQVLDIQGDLPECRVQVTVGPLGGSTMISVLYGAGCAGGDG
jgi:hypothetical protein